MPSFKPIGLGGGGAMFAPQISPADPLLIFVSCDMSGLYRSDDGGNTWSLLDERDVQATAFFNDLGLPRFGFSVAIDPTHPSHVLGARQYQELKLSADSGITWAAFPNTPNSLRSGGLVTAAAFDMSGNLVVAYYDNTVSPDATTLFIFDATTSTWATSASFASKFVSRLVTAQDPSGKNFFFAALYDPHMFKDEVLGYDGTQWASITSGSDFPNQNAKRTVLDLAASSDANGIAVYATVNTSPGSAPTTQIVKFTGNQWASAMGDLPSSADYYYDHLTMPSGDVQTVYLSGYASGGSPPNVWITTTGGTTWTGIYDGEPKFPGMTLNVIPEGWNEDKFGWGFGGIALGLCAAPSDAQTVVLTNLAVVHMTNNGKAAPANVRWHQCYTAQPQPSPTSSIGLEVTASWDYVVSGNDHFILYTDVGLAHSSDGGATWISAPFDTNGNRWDNWYQIISANSQLFAAVSELHNLTFGDYNWCNDHKGTVLGSGNNGTSWSLVTGTNLPTTLPVTSLAFGIVKNLFASSQTSLLACVWDEASPGNGGVYHSEDMGNTWASAPLPGIDATAPARCSRVLFDENGDLYCVVSRPGGNVYRWDPQRSPSPHFVQVPGLAAVVTQMGGKPHFHPLDLTARKSSSTGQVELYLGTQGVQGGQPSQLFKFDGTTWGSLNLSGNPPIEQYPHFFGAYFYGSSVYVTSIGLGTWSAPAAQVDGTASSTASWTEVGLPFLRTLRVYQDGGGKLYFTTFGSGVWTT